MLYTLQPLESKESYGNKAFMSMAAGHLAYFSFDQPRSRVKEENFAAGQRPDRISGIHLIYVISKGSMGGDLLRCKGHMLKALAVQFLYDFVEVWLEFLQPRS